MSEGLRELRCQPLPFSPPLPLRSKGQPLRTRVTGYTRLITCSGAFQLIQLISKNQRQMLFLFGYNYVQH